MSDQWGDVDDGAAEQPSQLRPVRADLGTGSTGAPSPAVRAAQQAVDKAVGKVRIETARVRAAVDAAPDVAPQVATAQSALSALERAEADALVDTATAQRRLDDAKGQLTTAQALLSDAEDGDVAGGKLVAARERVASRERAVAAAREELTRADLELAHVRDQLPAARERLAAAEEEPLDEPVEVLTARERLRQAEEDEAAARSELAAATAPDDTQDTEESANEFDTVYAFVQEYVRHIYAEQILETAGNVRWCPEWYRHPEAVARLEAAWQAFEALRVEGGTGRSVWFRDHGDPCMGRLLDVDGPFAQCRPGRHKAKPPLAISAPAPFLVAHPASSVHRTADADASPA